MRIQRSAVAWVVGAVALCVNCRPLTGPSIPEIGDRDWVVVFRLPDGIFSMTSSPDSALFVIAFSGGGPVYRARAGHDTEWAKVIVTQPGQPIFRTIYAASASTVFGFGDGHLLRWDERSGITDFGQSASGKFCGDFVSGFGVTRIWGRGDRDVFAVGSMGDILHYDGVRWTPMPTPISAEVMDACTAPVETILSSVGGDEHNVFAAGARFLSLTLDGRWIELPKPTGFGPGAVTEGIAAQGGMVFFGGSEFIRTNTNPPQFYRPLRLVAHTRDALRTISGFDYVAGMDGGGAQPGSAAVFWSFDKDLLIIDGTNIRALRMSGFRSVRGAVAVGHTIYVAGLPRDGDEEVVVRLR